MCVCVFLKDDFTSAEVLESDEPTPYENHRQQAQQAFTQQQQQLQQQHTVSAPMPVGGGGLGGLIRSDSTGARLGAMAAAVEPPQPTQSDSSKCLENYKVLRVIGKGSFGKVFLVREKETGVIYAMKVLRKDNIIKRNQVEHTRTERSVLGYVKHPFIVGLKMAFQTPQKLFFVLDYCAGGELFFHLGKVRRKGRRRKRERERGNATS
jgi:hypothetical protein